MLAGPLEVGVVGAQAYWLGDIEGNPFGPVSDRTLGPCTLALSMVESGTDPGTLVVWARLANGDRYRVSGGIALVDMAEAAAGLPRTPRAVTE